MSPKKVSLVFSFLIILISFVDCGSAVQFSSLNGGTAYLANSTTNQAWNVIRTGLGTSVTQTTALRAGRVQGGTVYDTYSYLVDSNIVWNTASIPDDAIIDGVIVSLEGSSKLNGIGSENFALIDSSPQSFTVAQASDLSRTTFTRMATDILYASFDTSGLNNFTGNAASYAKINKTGYTAFMISGSFRVDNTTPTWASGATSGFVVLESTAPILIVNWTMPGSAPVAGFTNQTGSPLTGVVPLTARFTDASTGSPTSWLWDFGDGDSTNSTVQNPIHVYSTAGTYNVNLTVSNAFGSDYEYKASYVHVLAAAPVADFTGTPTALLLGNSTTFTDSSTNTPTSWLWDFGDGNHAITQNPVYLWNVTGIYTVNLTASNGGGSDKKTRIDYVNVSRGITPTPTPTPTPTGVPGLFTRFDTNTTRGQFPLTVQFYDETVNTTSSEVTGYFWNFGDGHTSTDQNPLHVYNSTGIYSVTLIVSNSLGNSSYIKNQLISVTPLAALGRYFSDDGASLLLIGVAAGMILSTTFRRREQ